MRLSEAVKTYLDHRGARYSTATVKQDAYIPQRFMRVVGDLLVTSLTAEHVDQYMSGLLAEHRTRDGRTRPPVMASSHNQMRKRLGAFFLWLTQRGLTRTDLLVLTKPLPVQRKVRMQVGREVIWAMLDSAPNFRDRTILSLAFDTGLRSNEVSGLRIRDVDLKAMTLRVRITKSHVEDEMPITADLAGDLKVWLDEYAAMQVRHLARIPQPTDYLFPCRVGPAFTWVTLDNGSKRPQHRERGVDPLRPATRLHLVAQSALQAVGLSSRGEGIHTLRRSAARALYDSLLAEGGHEHAARVVSTWLHHANVSTTETYLGVQAERRVRDTHLRGRSLRGPRPTDADVIAFG